MDISNIAINHLAGKDPRINVIWQDILMPEGGECFFYIKKTTMRKYLIYEAYQKI